MTSSALRVTAPPGDVNAVHDFLADVWGDCDVDKMVQFKFETALIELTSNVIKHASRGIVTFTVDITVNDEIVEAVVVDDGIVADIELERTMPDDLSESGRGIPLIRALVDQVDHDTVEGKNRWRIATRLPV